MYSHSDLRPAVALDEVKLVLPLLVHENEPLHGRPSVIPRLARDRGRPLPRPGRSAIIVSGPNENSLDPDWV